MSAKNWSQAFRLPFLTASLIPVLLGTAVAWNRNGVFNPFWFFLCLLGVGCLHLGTNLFNDYYDHKSGCDDVHEKDCPFSGGSRVIQENKIPADQIASAACFFYALAFLIILYFNYISKTNLVLWIGLFGMITGFCYTATPFAFGYHGWGEFFVGLDFGILAVTGTYYVQTQAIDRLPELILISLPISFLITAVLYINEFPDYVRDKTASKKTIVVILGKDKAFPGYTLLIYGTFVVVTAAALLKITNYYTLAVLVTLPMALKALKIAKENYNDTQKLIPANALTIQLHLLTGLLLSISYIVDKLLS